MIRVKQAEPQAEPQAETDFLLNEFDVDLQTDLDDDQNFIGMSGSTILCSFREQIM